MCQCPCLCPCPCLCLSVSVFVSAFVCVRVYMYMCVRLLHLGYRPDLARRGRVDVMLRPAALYLFFLSLIRCMQAVPTVVLGGPALCLSSVHGLGFRPCARSLRRFLPASCGVRQSSPVRVARFPCFWRRPGQCWHAFRAQSLNCRSGRDDLRLEVCTSLRAGIVLVPLPCGGFPCIVGNLPVLRLSGGRRACRGVSILPGRAPK